LSKAGGQLRLIRKKKRSPGKEPAKRKDSDTEFSLRCKSNERKWTRPGEAKRGFSQGA